MPTLLLLLKCNCDSSRFNFETKPPLLQKQSWKTIKRISTWGKFGDKRSRNLRRNFPLSKCLGAFFFFFYCGSLEECLVPFFHNIVRQAEITRQFLVLFFFSFFVFFLLAISRCHWLLSWKHHWQAWDEPEGSGVSFSVLLTPCYIHFTLSNKSWSVLILLSLLLSPALSPEPNDI